MSKKVEVILNETAVIALLKSQEMISICENEAKKMQEMAGDGFEISKYVGPKRVNVSVIATTKKAVQNNLKHKTIEKILATLCKRR